MTYRPIIIVPFYNHLSCFKQTAKHYADTRYPILLVNDGSSFKETKGVKTLAKQYHFPYLELKQNSGKGAAVITGIKWAIEHNYTHALQIDSDGQHNYRDISKFFTLSKKNSHCIINGIPLYDHSVPKSRLYGRKITNFWVCIETGTSQIKDVMCGLKVYPLNEMKFVLPLLKFKRMGFDIEIIVKSYLNGINIVNCPTKVIYPPNGISHFKATRDNCEIFLTHTTLCLYSFYKRLFSWRKHV